MSGVSDPKSSSAVVRFLIGSALVETYKAD
jgi:hypothetical protein